MTPVERLVRQRQRLTAANAMIVIIASCGRQFFRHGDKVSRLELDSRGRVWLRDKYSGKEVFTHYRGRWRGFTEGGTLKRLVEELREFVMGKRHTLPLEQLGPWPGWCSDGDPWAYGDDMARVRNAAMALSDRYGLPRPSTRTAEPTP